jgi:hypothetical protein
MNTRIVDPRTLWAVLAMEAALALPIISLPAQGDRLPGLLGPLLLVALLPLGYLAVYAMPELRDPSWRLLVGMGLALLTRAIVSNVPAPGAPGLAVWLGRSVVPAAIGIGLWWRGGALCVAELTPAEVRTEFSVVAACLVVFLALVRPFLLPDATLLGGSVGLFALGGLVGMTLSRQDAAQVVPLPFGRTLAATTALLPAAAAVLLVSILRPELLGTLWLILARVIELALTPLGLLLALLGSLFPRGPAGPAPTPVPPPPPDALPNAAALAASQERLAWLAWLILLSLLLAVAAATLIAARLLLQNWISSPIRATRQQTDELLVERTGTPRGDAYDVLAWLLHWLRGRFARRARLRQRVGSATELSGPEAWVAYQHLLSWAERQGLGRRPAETTGQLEKRLVLRAPDSAEAVELVTRTYEWERYGAVRPPSDRLRRVRAALASLLDR